jgi:Putative zinc-finger
MTHPLPEQLSLYLDGELDSAATAALRSHLAHCGACSALLEELRRVVARARALEERPPRGDLWPGVAAAIGAGAGTARRRLTFTLPQLLAASLALMLLSGGLAAALLRLRPAVRLAQLPVATAPVVRPAGDTSDRGYEAAIRQLQGELDAGRGRLDTTTVRVVESKLRLIDRAIADAERALAADPANAYLTSHLTQTRMRKLDLLQRATALTHAVS